MTQSVDLILNQCTRCITMNEELQIFEPGALAIQGDSIVAVGTESDIRELYSSPSQLVDCGGKVLMPGLINAHTHVPMTLLRGLG